MTDGQFPFERLFSLPAFEGLKLLRSQLAENPSLNVQEAAIIIARVEADSASLDIEAAKAILELLPEGTANDGANFFRGCIHGLLVKFQPVWARTIMRGRSLFYQSLNRDEKSLFRQTGILDEPAPDDFVDWWDSLNRALRLIVDNAKMAQGRAAERLTLELERDRLLKHGINEQPRWIGLDDNTKGYDVLSFEKSHSGLVNKLIEVKSTTASPLRFRLTRNEWNQAEKYADAYIFHIWDMQKVPPILHVRTVEQVRPHVPKDNAKGKWKDAEIAVGI